MSRPKAGKRKCSVMSGNTRLGTLSQEGEIRIIAERTTVEMPAYNEEEDPVVYLTKGGGRKTPSDKFFLVLHPGHKYGLRIYFERVSDYERT